MIDLASTFSYSEVKRERSTQRIEVVQLLRAAAVVLVVGFHVWASATEKGFNTPFSVFRRGEAGVDLFFVISGFIIYYTSSTRAGLTQREFALSRFLRIYPAYWAVLAVFLAIPIIDSIAGIGLPTSYEISPLSVAASMVLFPYPNQIIDVAWTLTIELLFYAIFCATFFKFGARGFFLTMLVWSLISQAYLLKAGAVDPWLALLLYSGNIEFLFGALAAHAYLSKAGFHLPILLAGVGLLAAWLINIPAELGLEIKREWCAGIASALTLYGLLGFKAVLPFAIRLLAEASYVVYLTHTLLISVSIRVIDRLMGSSPFAAFWTTAMVFCWALAIGCLLHVLLERPFQHWYKARTSRRQLSLQ